MGRGTGDKVIFASFGEFKFSGKGSRCSGIIANDNVCVACRQAVAGAKRLNAKNSAGKVRHQCCAGVQVGMGMKFKQPKTRTDKAKRTGLEDGPIGLVKKR